tara:strand:+ start:262 stop:426 length:165 start_codon:yes stop_codon:yes gene_type:complete
MKYSTEQIKEFSRQQLIKDIESAKNATPVSNKESKINSFKHHLNRLEQMMIEEK